MVEKGRIKNKNYIFGEIVMKIKITEINEDKYSKIFIMTDIHGKYDLFKRLLDELKFTKEDLLIILGDSCDRGLLTYELYKKYIELQNDGYNVIHLLGNHEDMLYKSKIIEEYKINWLYNGGTETIKSFFNHQDKFEKVEEYWLQNEFYKEEWLFDFFERMPHVVKSKNYLFVHAGIDFSKSIQEQQEEYILWTRDKWYEKNKSEIKIFYGHTPQNNITSYNNCINLDSGSFYTNILNCIELKTRILYIVNDNKVIKKKFEIENINTEEARKREYENLLMNYREYIAELEKKDALSENEKEKLKEAKENFENLIKLK